MSFTCLNASTVTNNKQCVGKSEWPFNYGLNNYRLSIKSTLYERIEKEDVDNMTKLVETHEDDWITQLQTLTPKGLNNKLYHRDKY